MAREIHVYTTNENPKISREELKFSCKFMYSMLVSRKIHDATTIWINSIEVTRQQCAEGLDGRVMVKDYHHKNPREFMITINTLNSRRHQLITLGHELVHVKQYAKNQLGNNWMENDTNFVMWKKRRVNIDRKDYWFLDWEVEAHGKEYGLYHRYKNFIKANKLNFDT